MTREELLKKLTETDFTAFDLRLFLNTHPTDKNAIMCYNAAYAEAQKLKEEFEKNYGLLTCGKSNENYFSWIDNPWNWDEEFN